MKIEKNVPLPTTKRATKWPFVSMAVGDSVFYDTEQINGRAYRAAMTCGYRHGKKFVARPEGDGIRIWRQT